MRKIVALGTLLGVVGLFAVPADAQKTGPLIMNGGSHSPVPNPTFAVPVDLTYKVAWDIKVGSPTPGESNAAFGLPARFLNQSVGVGVPGANLQLAIVVHGTAGEELLSNEGYRARKGTDNPNVALLEELSKAGVRIILCGQTIASQKIPRDKLLPFVQVAPSAMWAHAVLQRQGFTVNPF